MLSGDLNCFCRPQGFPYFVPAYGYPQQRNNARLQPNNGQQNLERTTQRPQLPLQVRHDKYKLEYRKAHTFCKMIKNKLKEYHF